MAIDFSCLSHEELYFVSTKITEWGSMLKVLEGSNDESSRLILDYLYKLYGDKDILYGYRMGLTNSEETKKSLVYLQQRNYSQAL